MSDHQAKQVRKTPTSKRGGKLRGQALLEYVMILALAFIGLIAILTITGPAIGNVFSRTVYDLLGQTTTPQDPLEANEFWNLVTAVASYTPADVDLITNTPAPQNNPGLPPTSAPNATATYTFTPLPSGATAGPTTTPQDQDRDAPWKDTATDPNNWQTDFADVFTDPNLAPWNAQWWNLSTCNNGNIFSATDGSYTTAPTTTTQEQLIQFPRATHAYWTTTGSSPAAGVSTDFCSRFSNSVMLAQGAYTFRYRRDDGVRIFVDGSTQLVNGQDWNYSPTGTNYVEVNWVNPSTRSVPIVIQHRDTGSGAMLEVSLFKSGQSGNTADCNWSLVTWLPNSPPTAWHDSPPINTTYTSGQNCILRYRGRINLTLQGINNPFLEFSDAFDLGQYDRAVVSVAGSANLGRWYDRTVHTGPTASPTYNRQSFDLANFTDDLGATQDFRGQYIEIRFILITDSSATNADGWYLDDITVDNRIETVYTLGFSDAMDNDLNWVNRGGWTLSSENPHSSPTGWTDSEAGPYAPSNNNILELDGRIDLSTAVLDEPQFAFWHSYDLASGDAIYLEISHDRTTWRMITPNGTATYLAQNQTQMAYSQIVVPIPADVVNDAARRSRIYLRFRIQSNNSAEADGWYVDDFQIRNRPSGSIRPNWCDNVEAGGGNWIAGGNWGVTNSTSHAGTQAWTDSPAGNYAPNSDSTLELIPNIDLSNPPPSGFPTVVRPVLEFWHRWEIGVGDAIHVEVSTDGGANWTNTNLWSFTNGQTTLPRWDIHYSPNFNYMYSWQRDVIELSPWIGQTDLRLRFRLDARVNSDVRDGWYLDDICIREASTDLTINLPFADDFEGNLNNWYVGGSWAVSTNDHHSGVAAITESPAGNYTTDTNPIIELRYNINLTGTVEPTLYYWEHYEMGTNDRVVVEYMRVNNQGVPQTGWQPIGWTSTQTLGPTTRLSSTNRGWVRQQVNLVPYINQIIRIRFRLDALAGSTPDDGWYLDDISVVDRNGIETQYTADPYLETMETLSPGDWVYDHNWGTVLEPRSIGSGNDTDALGPGTWDATYIQRFPTSATCSFPNLNVNSLPSGSTNRGTYPVAGGQIAFDWSNNSGPAYVSPTTDLFAIEFTRTVNFPVDTTLIISYFADDGIRMYDNGVRFVNNWGCSGGSTTTVTRLFPAGDHVLRIQYVENTGMARIQVNFRQEFSTGSLIGPGPWLARWYNNVTGVCSASANLGTATTTTTYPDRLDFNWGTNYPAGVGINAGDTWGARFQMTIQLDYPTTYQIMGYRSDAFQVTNQNGTGPVTLISPAAYWTSCNSGSNLDPSTFYSFSYTFPAGANTITVDYYENTGSALFQLGLYTGSLVFHDSPPSNRPGGTPVDYEDLTDTSVTLEGQVSLAGTVNPALIWQDSVSLDLIDYTIIEVSTDEGFTWTEVYRRATDNPAWTQRTVDLTSFAGSNITIRFRLDAMLDAQVDDGWFIDNISIVD
ncbi:MAG: hypothetical protein BroJett018_06330 [Chloroflexota bacterium]|nr:hypothetical protein [Chloroflexota bacterium]NOG63029.1 hypothetical protein [Chloroflexota bacterium]GIK62839.1 MAG: hypothetical protein BroJett018_06330 [Chloroflexota bacterium]